MAPWSSIFRNFSDKYVVFFLLFDRRRAEQMQQKQEVLFGETPSMVRNDLRGSDAGFLFENPLAQSRFEVRRVSKDLNRDRRPSKDRWASQDRRSSKDRRPSKDRWRLVHPPMRTPDANHRRANKNQHHEIETSTVYDCVPNEIRLPTETSTSFQWNSPFSDSTQGF